MLTVERVDEIKVNVESNERCFHKVPCYFPSDKVPDQRFVELVAEDSQWSTPSAELKRKILPVKFDKKRKVDQMSEGSASSDHTTEGSASS